MRVNKGFEYVFGGCILILLAIGLYFQFINGVSEANFSTSRGFKEGDKINASGIFVLVIILTGFYLKMIWGKKE